jgi:hypothetical protein
MNKIIFTQIALVNLLFGMEDHISQLQWNQHVFGTWKMRKNHKPHSHSKFINHQKQCNRFSKRHIDIPKPKLDHTILIQELISLNNLRISGILSYREYHRSKGNILNKLYRCSIRKSPSKSLINLIVELDHNNGLNNREFIRIKNYLLK